MSEHIRPLGDAVKRARENLGLSQNAVADMLGIDVRTVSNIENYKGNPKMEILYPLIRLLKIDAREIFHPEMKKETPGIAQLRMEIEDCSEEEAAALVPIIKTVVSTLRNQNAMPIDE